MVVQPDGILLVPTTPAATSASRQRASPTRSRWSSAKPYRYRIVPSSLAEAPKPGHFAGTHDAVSGERRRLPRAGRHPARHHRWAERHRRAAASGSRAAVGNEDILETLRATRRRATTSPKRSAIWQSSFVKRNGSRSGKGRWLNWGCCWTWRVVRGYRGQGSNQAAARRMSRSLFVEWGAVMKSPDRDASRKPVSVSNKSYWWG